MRRPTTGTMKISRGAGLYCIQASTWSKPPPLLNPENQNQRYQRSLIDCIENTNPWSFFLPSFCLSLKIYKQPHSLGRTQFGSDLSLCIVGICHMGEFIIYYFLLLFYICFRFLDTPFHDFGIRTRLKLNDTSAVCICCRWGCLDHNFCTRWLDLILAILTIVS